MQIINIFVAKERKEIKKDPSAVPSLFRVTLLRQALGTGSTIQRFRLLHFNGLSDTRSVF